MSGRGKDGIGWSPLILRSGTPRSRDESVGHGDETRRSGWR